MVSEKSTDPLNFNTLRMVSSYAGTDSTIAEHGYSENDIKSLAK